MDFNDNTSNNAKPSGKPNAYRIEDNDNLEEKDLTKSYLFGNSEMKKANEAGMEGTGMGGSKFGQENLTPSGDDEANPSQNAGYTNEYFRRTEPSEEHPESSNFKNEEQSGQPDYSQAQPTGNAEPGPDQSDNDTYQEGTADNDGDKNTNIPGPNELPDQQKVGEGSGKNDGGEKYHVET